MKDSIIAKLESLKERYEELEALLGDASVISDQDKFRAYSKEYSQLEDVVKCFNRWNQLNTNIAEAELMLDDPEMKEMAEMEIEESKAEIEEVEQQLQILLLPKDPNDEYNCYLEIRAGTGGDEAGIFAGDLFRMYSRYAESKRWRVEMLSANESEQGGYKEVIVKVSGDGVYGQLKFESGGHRVQRVPKTESQGRIHTSACTVAVMPELPESEMPEINPADLRIDTYRSSGAGGQHVNRTESAVRITHLPSGIVVACQDERSQLKNKDKAMRVLRAKLQDQAEQEAQASMAADRKSQVGTGDRSERIRTYNYPQGRVTDHRINLTLYKLDAVLNGDLDEVIQALNAADQAAKMQEANTNA